MTHLFFVVVGHLQPSPLKAALDVEALIGLTTVENSLVAADLFGNKVERLDQAQAQFFALLVLCNGDILNMADQAQVVDTARIVSTKSRSGGAEVGRGRLNGCMGSQEEDGSIPNHPEPKRPE